MANVIVAPNPVVPLSCGCGIVCEMHRLALQMVEMLREIADSIGLFDANGDISSRWRERFGGHEQAT